MDKIQQEVKKLQLSSIATTERMVMDFKIFTRDNYPSTDSIDFVDSRYFLDFLHFVDSVESVDFV